MIPSILLEAPFISKVLGDVLTAVCLRFHLYLKVAILLFSFEIIERLYLISLVTGSQVLQTHLYSHVLFRTVPYMLLEHVAIVNIMRIQEINKDKAFLTFLCPFLNMVSSSLSYFLFLFNQ